MRQRCVRTLPLDGDFKRAARGHERAAVQGKAANRPDRPIMQTENSLARKPLKQTIIDHFLGAGLAHLFSWLKNKMHRAVKITRLR